eukprot:530267_1
MLRQVSRPCNVRLEESLFPIHSIHGSSGSGFATCHNSNVCAYASESVAIIWNWAQHNHYQYLIGGHNNEAIHSLCFHPNSQILITASFGSLCIWDIATSTVLHCCRLQCADHTLSSIHLTMSSDARHILLVSNAFILIYSFIINSDGSIHLSTTAYYQFIEDKDLIVSIHALQNLNQQFVTLCSDQIQFWK